MKRKNGNFITHPLSRTQTPIQLINDNYKKQILTLDELPEADDGGIIRRNIRDWLMETGPEV